MSTTLMTEPAAGWYHDPTDAGAWRWWDGTAWTDHVRAMDGGDQASATVEPPQVQPTPTHAPVFEPVAIAAPVSAPTPIQPQPTPTGAIPQPGQVAATPAVGGPVSMTPETPVSDQMYWHSAAAEVIAVPRIQSATAGSSISPAGHASPSYVRDWNDLGSPNTAGIWLLAFLPVIGLVVNVTVQVAMSSAGVTGQIPAIVGSGAVLLLAWTFAGLDARALAERGYYAPRLAWMLLLPPLAYLIARGKTVRRESKRAWPPELVYVLNLFGTLGLVLAASVFLAVLLAPYLPAS